MNIQAKLFEELSNEEIWEIYKIRNQVFVVEQECVYQDIDEFDKVSYHILFSDKDGIQGYARVLPAHTTFDEVSIGRVISLKRRCGIGTKVVKQAIKIAVEKFHATKIVIEAQVYAVGLYEKVGFQKFGEEFLEDGIPHIKMYFIPEQSVNQDRSGSYLKIMQEYLEEREELYHTGVLVEIEKRKKGKKYSIQEHLRGIIYSLLSSQTKWIRIEPHLLEIDQLFFYYDPEKICSQQPKYFYNGLFEMKCGNRSTRQQMAFLEENIKTLQRIEEKYGSIDAFITSDSAEKIVKKLSNVSSPYKIKMLGEALAWEYLRNVGIDGVKPDTHLCRFLGADRMGTGHSLATSDEVVKQVERLAAQTGMLKAEIDNLIWSFCADGYGKICTAIPHCEKCPIRKFCKKI